jgi:hypothetical protein
LLNKIIKKIRVGSIHVEAWVYLPFRKIILDKSQPKGYWYFSFCNNVVDPNYFYLNARAGPLCWVTHERVSA